MPQPSYACCTVPPVVTKGYEAKGEYITINGMKTYRTGPKSARRVIFLIMDIFGFFPQSLQGADILAHSDHQHPYQIFMPDWFDGKPADISWYPPTDEEKKAKIGEFFKTLATPPRTLERVPNTLEEIEGKIDKGVEVWGVVGFCWGGKIANLLAKDGTRFKAAAACHPAMVDPEDALKITIPFAMLPSKDEDEKAVNEWKSKLKVPNLVEFFPTQIHGWMAARSNLDDPEVRKEYERGYKTLLDFFHDHL